MKKNSKNTTTENKVKKKKTWTAHRIINTVCVLFLSGILMISSAMFFIVQDVLKDSKSFSGGDIFSTESSRIYSDDGEVIYENGTELRTNITYDQIPQTVVDAFLSIEDSRFFTHNGFDLPRFISSMMNNVKLFTSGDGNGLQGGSTLTMQLIDQFYTKKSEAEKAEDSTLTSYQKLRLKAQEIFLALDAESTMPKDQIITDYLNQVNFGGNAYGIQKGSQYYFGKDVSELNLSESAFLAGVVNSPYYFNPYNFYDYAVNRRDTTLSLMLQHGYITEEEYTLSKGTQLSFQMNGADYFLGTPYQSYIDVVTNELSQYTDKQLSTSGIQVYTYMNKGAQELADSISDGTNPNVAYPKTNSEGVYEAAFTLVDNETGGIIALSGGRNYNEQDSSTRRNRSQEPKQPGSTMKPLVSYTPAFDDVGWATSHVVNDEPVTYAGNKVMPNFYAGYKGKISLEEAVGISTNTTALKATQDGLNTSGYDRYIQLAKDLGFSDTVAQGFNEQYAVGGSTMEASTAEMAAAYASFANGGEVHKPVTIKKIVDSNGDVIYDAETTDEENTTQPYSPQAAYMMSTLLDAAVNKSYANMMTSTNFSKSYKVYGKSGTTNWSATDGFKVPDGSMKDNWMINYTSKYSIATWTGFDNGGTNNYITIPMLTANVAGNINKEMLNYTYSEFGNPGVVQQPSGLSSITHLWGVFPYVSAPEGMRSVTGLIIDKYNKLGDFDGSLAPLSNLEGFTVTAVPGSTSQYAITFTPYPYRKEDEASSGDSLSIEDMGITVTYTVVVTDESGNVLATFENAEPTFTIDLDSLFPGIEGQKITISGSYRASGMTSNEISYSVTIPKKPTEPNPGDGENGDGGDEGNSGDEGNGGDTEPTNP